MRGNNIGDHSIKVQLEDIKEVDKLVFLASIGNTDKKTNEDIKCKINEARHQLLLQSNMYSSNSEGKLDVFENAEFELAGGMTMLNKFVDDHSLMYHLL